MAELTKTQLKAAADRAGELSLAEDDVALITSDTMPSRVGVRGKKLDSAGNDQHDPSYSFTRKQVDKALDEWGADQDASSDTRSSRGRGTRASSGNGRRRGAGRATRRTRETETGTAASDTDQPTQPAGTEPPAPEDAKADTGKGA